MSITDCKLMARSVEDGPRSWTISMAIMVPIPLIVAGRPSMSMVIQAVIHVAAAPLDITFGQAIRPIGSFSAV